jgi:hypothetical protein
VKTRGSLLGGRNFEAYRFSDEENVVPFPVVDGSTDVPAEFSHGLGGLRIFLHQKLRAGKDRHASLTEM